MNNPVISILIPVYGVEKFIEKCAESLFKQTYNNIEYIFVNDCTKDSSIEKLMKVKERYCDRNITIIEHPVNKGLSASRNTAYDNCSGDYVMPFDSDDWISEETAIECMMNALIEENADVVLYDMQHVYENKVYIPNVIIPKRKIEVVQAALERKIPVTLWGGIYRRSIYTHSIEGISMGEDYVVKPMILYKAEKIIHVNKPYYCYNHTNEKSYTQLYNVSRIYDMAKCVDFLYNFFSSKDDYSDYRLSIERAKSQTLCEMYINCAMGDGGRQDFALISKILPNAKHINMVAGMRNKILIALAKMNAYGLIKLFVRNGVKVKYLMK